MTEEQLMYHIIGLADGLAIHSMPRVVLELEPVSFISLVTQSS